MLRETLRSPGSPHLLAPSLIRYVVPEGTVASEGLCLSVTLCQSEKLWCTNVIHSVNVWHLWWQAQQRTESSHCPVQMIWYVEMEVVKRAALTAAEAASTPTSVRIPGQQLLAQFIRSHFGGSQDEGGGENPVMGACPHSLDQPWSPAPLTMATLNLSL